MCFFLLPISRLHVSNDHLCNCLLACKLLLFSLSLFFFAMSAALILIAIDIWNSMRNDLALFLGSQWIFFIQRIIIHCYWCFKYWFILLRWGEHNYIRSDTAMILLIATDIISLTNHESKLIGCFYRNFMHRLMHFMQKLYRLCFIQQRAVNTK